MDLAAILADLDLNFEQLTSWERNFLTSVKEQYNRRGRLSTKQVDILKRVQDNYTAEVQQARDAWICAWTPEKAADLRVVAKYYKSTSYFQNVVDRILTGDNYIPSEKLFGKIIENKYAQRVLAAYHADSKYAVGQMAIVKSANRSVVHDQRVLVGKPVLILEVMDYIVSAAKGSKLYFVANVADPRQRTHVEERDLKKFKRNK